MSVTNQQYRPSLSNGIYGGYIYTSIAGSEVEASSYRTSSIQGDTDEKECILDDIPIEPIYEAAKKTDEKYKLIFNSICNHKGCNNKPEFDATLLNGDMYICKKHRIAMANKLKAQNTDCKELNSMIIKLQTYDDKHFYEEGLKLQQNDYFLSSYSQIQQRRLQIMNELKVRKLNPNDAEYWSLTNEYVELKEAAELLCNVRKISNPFLAILAVVAIAAFVGLIVGVIVWASSLGSNRYKAHNFDFDARKEWAEKQKKNYDKCRSKYAAAMKVLSDTLTKNEDLKTDCILKIKKLDDKISQNAKDIDDCKTFIMSNDKETFTTQQIEQLSSKLSSIQQEINTLKNDKFDDDEYETKKVNYQTEIERIGQELDKTSMDIGNIDKETKQIQNELQKLTAKDMNKIESYIQTLSILMKNKNNKQEQQSKNQAKLEEQQLKLQLLREKAERERKAWEKANKLKLKTLQADYDTKLLAKKKCEEELKSHKDAKKKLQEIERRQKQLEKERKEKQRKKEEAEKKIDETNWKKAVSKCDEITELLKHQSLSSDKGQNWMRVGIAVAYDSTKRFDCSYDAAYADAYYNESYYTFGKYKVLKFTAYKGRRWSDTRSSDSTFDSVCENACNWNENPGRYGASYRLFDALKDKLSRSNVLVYESEGRSTHRVCRYYSWTKYFDNKVAIAII